jgi:thiamine biosynthesis protein ThiS
VEITVNGEPRQLIAETTVAQLLAELEVNARHVAVEVNRDLVPRAEHSRHVLRPGDHLEVVTLVGGG